MVASGFVLMSICSPFNILDRRVCCVMLHNVASMLIDDHQYHDRSIYFTSFELFAFL